MTNKGKTMNKKTLAFALALAGCGGAQDPVSSNVGGLGRIGWVSLVDGTAAALDVDSMREVTRVKLSSQATHMLRASRAGRTLLYGDWDAGQVLVLDFSDDMRTYVVTDRIDCPVEMHAFTTHGVGDRYIVVFPRVELIGARHPRRPDDSVAVFDRTDRTWRTIPTGSPSTGVFGIDGKLYVTNVHHKTVSVIDPTTWEVESTVDVGHRTWPTGALSIGPKGIAVSPDGRTLVTADYEGLSITVMRLDEFGMRSIDTIDVDGTPKSVAFSPDGTELWTTSYDLNVSREQIQDKTDAMPAEGTWYDGPRPGDEAWNAYRKTTTRVFSTSTWTEVGQVRTPHAAISPIVTPDRPDSVFVTTSAGSVYSLDRPARAISGEVSPGRIGLPVICGDVAF